jgi:fumarate reductase subunit C
VECDRRLRAGSSSGSVGGQLSRSQLLTLEILVWLLQVHKQIRIERLAAHFPLPIKFESRRRHLQRFLKLSALSIPIIWFPIIKAIIKSKVEPGQRLYLAIDRTQWKDKNLFLVAVIFERRALPIYWQFLEKLGASNLVEQQALLRPVLKLLKKYELVVLGDREFHSVTLAAWLKHQKVYFVFRQKKDTNIKFKGKAYQQLNSFGYSPGMKMFLTGIKVTQSQGFGGANIGVYWKRKYRRRVEKEPWYLLTNFSNLEETLKPYKKRAGIEAMFKDCKSGGYNLASSKASTEPLTRLVLLIAIAYSFSTLKGKAIKSIGQQKYIGRLREIQQSLTPTHLAVAARWNAGLREKQ